MKVWNLPIVEVRPFGDVEGGRDVALICGTAAWEAVQDRVGFEPVWRGDVTEATEAHWRSVGGSLAGEVIYAVGGGVAVDAAKYLGREKGLPVVSMPTAMTVDAFFTWAAGVREDGCVRYDETGPPERVVIDLDVLGSAPESLRAAGVCDLLSIATGSWDWRFARDKGKLDETTRYLAWVDDAAGAILEAAIDCAEGAGRGDGDSIKQLVDCLALEVQLCNQIGHSRPEEGSEHYFAYCVEHHVSSPMSHGELVGPGILIAAHLQGQDTERPKRALEAARVPLTHLPEASIRRALEELADYANRHDLAYGVAHTVASAPADIGSLLK